MVQIIERRGEYAPDNPLNKFKKSNEPYSWEKMSDETGLTVQSLINIAKKERDQIKSIKIGTYEILKEKLEVDLLDW